MSGTDEPADVHGSGPASPRRARTGRSPSTATSCSSSSAAGAGWSTPPCRRVAFIVANSAAGLRTGIWAALGAAVLIFLFRLARRESVQQAFSGLFAVAIAVAIAANSGEARDFFVLGIIRNAAIGVVLLGSVALRRPLIGYLAEFLAPSHLGGMAAHSLPWLGRGAGPPRRRRRRTPADGGAGPRARAALAGRPGACCAPTAG